MTCLTLLSFTVFTITTIHGCNLWNAGAEARPFSTTARVTFNTSKHSMLMSSSFWKSWHYIFHNIMMPTYILTSVSTRIKTEARVIAFVTIEMLALYINQIVY